eukprot:SAG25_NODE_1920_length_2145_cov_2.107038_1_plen_98_part_10
MIGWEVAAAYGCAPACALKQVVHQPRQAARLRPTQFGCAMLRAITPRPHSIILSGGSIMQGGGGGDALGVAEPAPWAPRAAPGPGDRQKPCRAAAGAF